MNPDDERGRAVRLLQAMERGGTSAMDAAVLAESIDPVLFYAVVSFLRAVHRASDPAAGGILERVVKLTSASPALIRRYREGDQDAIARWFESEYAYTDFRGRGDDFAEFVCGRPDADLALNAKAIRRRFRPDVVALVVSATGTPCAWRTAYERFSPFGLTHVVFTHWDEHQPWWDAAAFSHRHAIPLAFRTHGFEPFGEIDPFTATDLRSGLADHVTRSVGGEVGGEKRQ